MTLEPGALAEIVAANLRTGTALVCHLTTYRQQPDLGEVLCRGYFDAYGDDTQSVQVLRRLAAHWGEVDPFEVVDVPAETTPS